MCAALGGQKSGFAFVAERSISTEVGIDENIYVGYKWEFALLPNIRMRRDQYRYLSPVSLLFPQACVLCLIIEKWNLYVKQASNERPAENGI